jgi:hypothetical protein
METRVAKLESGMTDIRTILVRMEGKMDASDERLRRMETDVARMDGKFDAFDERLRRVETEVVKINGRFDVVDARFDAVDARFDAVDQRFEAVEQRFEAVDQRFDAVDRQFVQAKEIPWPILYEEPGGPGWRRDAGLLPCGNCPLHSDCDGGDHRPARSRERDGSGGGRAGAETHGGSQQTDPEAGR